jgi:hypothetical protein
VAHGSVVKILLLAVAVVLTGLLILLALTYSEAVGGPAR